MYFQSKLHHATLDWKLSKVMKTPVSIFHPYFIYSIYELKKLNERVLYLVYQDKSSSYEALVVKNGNNTLANQRLAKMLSTVFRGIGNGNVPACIAELLTTRNSNYN